MPVALMVIVFYLSFLLWGVTIGKGLMSYSLLLVNLMADDSISMSLLFGYLHKKHQMRRVTRFLWRLIRKQACGHRVRERIACFPNWLMGIEGDVVSCLYEIASFLSIIPVFLGDAIESWWDNFLREIFRVLGLKAWVFSLHIQTYTFLF